MDQYKVIRIIETYTRESTEVLRKKTEECLNQKTGEGYELVSIDFELSAHAGYIYSFLVFKR